MKHVQKNSLEQKPENNQTENRINALWNKHKKKVYLLGGATIAVVCGYYGVKYRDDISGLIVKMMTTQTVVDSKSIISAVENSIDTAISENTPVKLTGDRLPPRGLGSLVNRSAQAMNNLLVEKGFQTRLPSGGYILTEKGLPFGSHMIKATKYDYVFSNIDWDTGVLEYLLDPEELVA